MTDIAAARPAQAGRLAFPIWPGAYARPFPILAITALLVGVAGALVIDWHGPLWLDEAFTAAIARDDARGLYAWCLEDPNAPLYYALIWLWGHLAGTSDLLLRLPSTACWLSAVILVAAKGHPDRDVRLAWAAMLALWVPGWEYASEARCYALLLLLSCGQALLFMRLINRGGRSAVLAWAGMAAAACITHYYALVPTALQGLAYLAMRPREAMRNWPAALFFVPVGIWLAIHLPYLARYTAPGTSWYPPMTIDDAAAIAGGVWGGMPTQLVLVFVGLLGLEIVGHVRKTRPWRHAAGETLVAATALLALCIFIGTAFLKPAILLRYLIPTVPGILLGVVLLLRHAWRGSRIPLAALLTAWLLWGAIDVGLGWRNFIGERADYSFDHAAGWMHRQGVRRFTFFWDHPNAGLYAPQRLAEIAAGPLRRDGWSGPVGNLVLHGAGTDPNLVIPNVASRPGDAVLWAYDTRVTSSLGNRHPPRLAADPLNWNCRNFGGHTVTILACIRR